MPLRPPPREPDVPGDRPIPPLDDHRLDGIVIRECGEPLVEVPEHGRIHVAPAYHERGIRNASKEVKLRRRVLDRLRQAAESLPDGTDLLVWDGLRSLDTQAEIVGRFRATLPENDREATVERYLAPPPESEEAFRRYPPPHSTGGAVDLTLCDPSGRPMDMGADFDQFDEQSWLSYYEPGDCRSATGPSEAERCRRRRILYWAMLGAGFAPYPWEYWHYELGTRLAASFHDRSLAEYGAAVEWILV
jgi:D-alanyl-D-alanine dipeptidase